MKVGAGVGRNVVIENPVVNSPFTEPRRHFRFDDDGITDELVESRRSSSYFIPIASAKKQGKLGEQIKCVVSVSMLTEGWDANTVTHVLGVRAFGTQLLCEQVVGRGLRRMSYSTTRRTVETSAGPVELEVFPTEYAEVYGVPFSFIPVSGHTTDPKPDPIPTHVRAVPERVDCEITFPRLDGYRYELPAERLDAKFDAKSRLVLTTQHVPTKVENAPIVGETAILTLDELKGQREQKMAQTLEDMDEVLCYVKNHNLGFFIPYTINGQQRNYIPDFIAYMDDGRGKDDPLKLIIEVTGQKDKDKEAKVATAATLWAPAVNNAGVWGRCGYVKIRDPWNVQKELRQMMCAQEAGA